MASLKTLTLSPESPTSKHRYFLPVSQFLKPVTRVSNPRCGILGTAHLTCHTQVSGMWDFYSSQTNICSQAAYGVRFN